MYPPGTRVRFLRVGMPFIGRVVMDDPDNARAKVRVEAGHAQLAVSSMTTVWVDYRRITGLI